MAACKSYLSKSLFVVGEFGGNDYNAMLFGNYNTDQASTYTPQIVSTIAAGVEKLVAMGAKDVVVPGVLPIGCFPIYLTLYGTSSSGDYDGLGCLKKFNDLSTNHNSQLKAQLASLQAKYPSARIMYADFYSGVYDMVRSPGSYGFSTNLRACCGAGGGKYNYQNGARCGMAGASACGNPAASLSWDGIHLTEAAYKKIADGWVSGAYCHPAIGA